MSFGNRGIGRGMPANPRPGLLGAGPGSAGRRVASMLPQTPPMRRDRGKQGLLGSAPSEYDQGNEIYEREDHYSDRRDTTHEEQMYDQEGDRYRSSPSPVDGRFPPKTRRLMENFGLTSSDLKELSRLPDHQLSSENFIHVIKDIKERKKANSQSNTRQPVPERYEMERDPSYRPYEDSPRFEDGRGEEDAFSSFQEKWYSESSKKDEREQQTGSILRASRGPMVKTTRWQRDDRHPSEQNQRRYRQSLDSPPRRMSPSPQRRASPVMQHRSRSPPMRRMSPPRRPSPRRQSPPRPMRMAPPASHNSGLLGDPREPSTRELDMLAASAGRADRGNFRSPPRDYPEPRHREPPVRTRTPPPLMAQPLPMKRPEPVLDRRPLRPGPPDFQEKRGPPPLMNHEKLKPRPDLSFAKSQASSEAEIMRREQGRVLYLRYQARAMGVIRDEHLVKLAQPFEKVTNILLTSPANLTTGWYQAFVELAHYDGAAAMLEHYMTRPPTVDGVTMMVQRSKHQTLQLRKDQMNRDFDHLLKKNPGQRRKRASSLSPDRSKKRPPKSQRDSSREHASPRKKTQGKQSEEASDAKAKSKNTNNHKEKAAEKKDSSVEPKKENAVDAKKVETKLEPMKKVDVKVEPASEPTPSVPVKQEALKEVQTNGETAAVSNFQDKKNVERLAITRDNLDQATTMCDELLKVIKEDSAKEILSEVMEYLADSTNQVQEIQDTLK